MSQMQAGQFIVFKIISLREVMYLAMITNLTLFMTYSITYNENNRNIRPMPRIEITRTESEVRSSFDKFLEKKEEVSGRTKFIYHVSNEDSVVGKKGVLFNKEYFQTSKDKCIYFALF